MATKKPSRKQATPIRHRESHGLPGWLMGLVTGLVLGIFGMFLFHLMKLPPDQNAINAANKSQNAASNATSKKTSTSPRFDFYKLLPENAPNAPNAPTKTPTDGDTTAKNTDAFDSDEPPTPNTPIESQKNFLQAGAFHTAADADRIRASIILLGLNAQVEKITNDKSKTLHRVQVGPFNSVDELKKAQALLNDNHINAIAAPKK